MTHWNEFKMLLHFLCVRIVVLAIICVFAENMAMWLYLLSPYSVIISPPQIILMLKILGWTLLIAFAGVVALAFLESKEDESTEC